MTVESERYYDGGAHGIEESRRTQVEDRALAGGAGRGGGDTLKRQYRKVHG